MSAFSVIAKIYSYMFVPRKIYRKHLIIRSLANPDSSACDITIEAVVQVKIP